MNQQQLKEYTSKCHEAAKLNGWHEQTRTETEIILLIKSEMFKAFKAYRKQKYTSKNAQSTQIAFSFWERSIFDKFYFETIIKDTFEDELADTAIRIFDAAGLYNIDIPYREPKKCLHEFSFIDVFREFDIYSARIERLEDFHLSYLLLIVQETALTMNINLIKHIEFKLQYNATRGKRHGGKIL